MATILCPLCRYSRSWSLRRNKRKCKSCRHEFSSAHAPIKGFRATKRTWKIVIGIFLRERTEKRIAEEAGLSLKTAQRMAHHLRKIMSADTPKQLPGPIEMDEAYIGGQRKNMRLHIRRLQGKRGHGTDKLPIVGLFSRESGQVYIDVEPKKLDVKYIIKVIQDHVPARAEIYTDGFKMYRQLSKYGYLHEYVDHADGEYVRGNIHTNNIEGFWGIMKRKLSCIGGMRRDRLHLFVGEIAWKFNHRNLSLKDQERVLLELILKDAIGGNLF
jgi:transposase-like protein